MPWGRDVRLPEGVIAAGRRSYKARIYLSSQERIAGANKLTTGFRSNARMYLSSQARITGANKINHRVSF